MNYRYLKTTYLVPFLFVAVCAIGSFGIPDIADAAVIKRPPNNLGLVGYWSFDEGRGTSVGDFSGQGNDGALGGNPQWGDGRMGGSMEFDGDGDYVDFGNPPPLDVTKDFTLVAWINPSTISGNQGIIHKGDNSSDKQYMFSLTSNGSLRFDYERDTNNYAFVAGSVDANAWQQVAVTVDENLNVVIYKNGASVGSDTAPAEATKEGAVVRIGSGSGTYTDWEFNGSIDDARIYSRTLSESEIKNLYNNSGRTVIGATPGAINPLVAPATTTVYGEAGTISANADGGWKTVNFDNTYADPVVLGTVNYDDSGSSGVVFEARNVTSNSAEMRLCEIKGDGGPTPGCATLAATPMGYVVFDKTTVNDLEGIEVGTVSVSGDIDSNTEAVSFDETFGSTPNVFVSVNTVDGDDPIEARTTNKSTTGFDASICHQNSTNGCDSAHGAETVAWLAIEPGFDLFDQNTITGTAFNISNDDWTSRSFSPNFSAVPAVLAEIQENNGGEESEVDEVRQVTTSGMEVRFCEVESDGSCDTHNANDVAWAAFSPGDLSIKEFGEAVPSLISHWTFDGQDVTSTTVKDMFGDYDGTRQGNPIARSGILGQSFAFRASAAADYIDIPDPFTFTEGSAITFSSWIYWEGTTSPDSGLWHHTGGPGHFEIRSDGMRIRLRDAEKTGMQTPEPNQWVHVAFTHDPDNGGLTTLYYDGEEIDSFSGTTGGDIGGTSMTFGRSLSSGRWFDGRMDDIRMYDAALPADEIKRLYNITKPSIENANRNDLLTNGMVGHWSFDGPDVSGSTADDVSGNGNDGTLNGDTKPAAGMIGQALELDGDADYIEAGDDDSLDWSSAEDLGLSMWIKANVEGEGPRLIAKRSGGLGDGYNLQIAASDRLVFTVLDDTETYQIVDTTAGDISAGEWYHVAVSADRSSDVRIYIDGELAGTGDWQGSGWEDHDYSNTNSLRIGTLTSASANFNGRIDDVRIYNRTLSADEVKRLYSLGW